MNPPTEKGLKAAGRADVVTDTLELIASDGSVCVIAAATPDALTPGMVIGTECGYFPVVAARGRVTGPSLAVGDAVRLFGSRFLLCEHEHPEAVGCVASHEREFVRVLVRGAT